MSSGSLTPEPAHELRPLPAPGPHAHKPDRAPPPPGGRGAPGRGGGPRPGGAGGGGGPACDFLGPLTLPGLSQLLQRVGIHYKAARDYVHRPDPDDLEKLAYIDRRWAEALGSNG